MITLRRILLGLCWAAAAVGASTAWAHKGSDAYLDVQERINAHDTATKPILREYRFSLAVALKDLDLIAPVDANADGKITWAEVKTATPLLLPLINQAVNVKDASPTCSLQWRYDGLERRADGAYLRLQSTASCPYAQALALHYTLLQQQDASHRLLITGRVAGHELLTTASPQQSGDVVLHAVLGHPASVAALASAPPSAGRWSALVDYFKVGFFHLIEGYDHLAFLLALVLPLRLRWGRSRVSPAAAQASSQWGHLLYTVTAFTLGHSITLVLAALGWLHASPTWVEPVIALSIGFTAVLNLRPVAWLRTDGLALLFGLVHGFGFAGLLLEANAPAGLLPWALAGFNAGIEVGQLLAVATWVGLAQLGMHKDWYQRVVVRGGSVVLVLLAAWWFWDRVQ